MMVLKLLSEQDDLDRCDFIEELASPTPAPGGGSAAAFAGAMGAALVCMVAGLTIGKKKYLMLKMK